MPQLRWESAQNEFGNLPKSIKVFRTRDSLNGHPFAATYIEVRLRDKEIEFGAQPDSGRKLTPQDYYLRENTPYIVVSGGYPGEGANATNLVIDNQKVLTYHAPALKSHFSDSFYYPTRGALGLSKGRRPDVAWIFNDTAAPWPYAFQNNPVLAKGKKSNPSFADLRTVEYWTWWHKQTAIGGGPVLVKNRNIYITMLQEQISDTPSGRRARIAIGYKSKRKLIILAIHGVDGATLTEEAKILQDLECKEALHLAAGANACLLINGSDVLGPPIRQTQYIRSVFLVKKRAANKR